MNLHGTLTDTNGDNVSSVMTYSVVGAVNTWTSACLATPLVGTLSKKVVLTCNTSGSVIPATVNLSFYNPVACAGTPVVSLMTLGAHTCSPLSIVWTIGIFTFTLTP